MSYTPTNWVDNETPVNSENMNKIERAIKAMYDLIAVTSEDDGKILQVVGGVWTVVTVADSAVATYLENYINEALEGDY